MRRLSALLALASTVATGAIVGGMSTAAHAATTEVISCEVISQGSRGIHFKLIATADYEDDNAAGRRMWKSFTYRLQKIREGVPTGERNNVDIKVSKLGVVALDLKSPDDRRWSQSYTVRLKRPVYTSLRGPNGERDHRTNHLVEIKATFDVSVSSDPSCPGWIWV